MPIPLSVLIVEDNESDAQFLVRLLKKADYDFVYEQVQTAVQMRSALEKRTWDIVVSDYNLPQFDGQAALTLLQETRLDIPFIVVSGKIGEETAVAMMKAGAQDYLIKDNLARFIPAVERELIQAKLRRRRKQAEEALRESEDRYRTLVEFSPDSICIHCEGKIVYANAATVKLLHANSAEDLIGVPAIQFVHPDYRAVVVERIQRSYENRQPASLLEEKFITLDEKTIEVEVVSVPIVYGGKAATQLVIHDITERKQVEQALVESESKFRWLYEYAPTAYHLLAPDGSITDVNQRWCELLGYFRGEVIGKSIFDFVVSGEKDEAKASFEKKKQSRQSFVEGSERNFLTKNGAVKIFKTFDYFLLDQDENIKSVQTTIEDITERVLTEEALRIAEANYRAIFEHAPTGIFQSTSEGRYQSVNPAMARIYGYDSPQDMIAGVTDVSQQIYVNSYDRQEFQRLMAEHGEVVEFVAENYCRDGRIIWTQTTARVEKDALGNVLYYEGFLTDITKRKQAEKSLHEKEEQYRTLVEQLPALVYIDDAKVEGRTLYMSPQIEKMYGFTPQEWQAESPGLWSKQVHSDDLERVHAAYMRCFLYGEPFNAEYRISASGGRLLWVRDQAVMLRDENGKPNLIHGVTYDITDRKQAEEALQTTNMLLEQTLEQSPIPTVLVSMPDGVIRSANSACRRFLGVEDEPSPIGMPLSDLKISWQDFDMKGTPAAFEELPLPRSLMGLKTDPQERRILRKNGTSVYGLVYGSPIFDSADNLIAGYLVMIDITERKQAEESIHQHVAELEMLYQSGLTLSQLLNPKEIGQKILELLEEKMNWHHTRIRLYHPQDDSLELLDFNQPGLKDEMQRVELVERVQSLVTRPGQGMSGWVVRNGVPLRSGDVRNDSRYVEAYPGINSGLYVPMKMGERIVGVISIESEAPDAFSAADERLIITLANQAASAFDNARLFEEAHQRVMELETINRISLVLRTVSKQDEMLSIVLDEALAILNTAHGGIELYNKAIDKLEKTVTRGWATQVIEPPQNINEGIAGLVFTNGQTYISREFASDPETRAIARSQMPPGWGGIFMPIRTTQQTLGVLIVSVPSGHELSKDEIRLLATLSEMTGSALQRMQLNEQTAHHLERLNALRTVDQAIASSRDLQLTLNILLTHAISQLSLDAAGVLLFHPGTNLLESVAGRGFHTSTLEGVSLNDSFAGRAIVEHRMIKVLDFETARQYPQFGKLWRDEGFACYWCTPLIVKGEVKGVLEAFRRSLFTPDAEWFEFLEALAGQAAITIDNTQLFEYLQRANLDLSLAYDATIEGWSRAMDMRDHETEGHTLRVTDLTVKLARAMNISASQLTAVRRGALLHDIGKMGIPDSILLKEGKLTEEEWEMMRKHPQFAYDMLAPVGYLNDALDIPYCHHEKWDGTGYPQGLKGDRIPLVARIFAIVDVWDALTNNRTYRKKWTKPKAIKYIKEQSGRHFDPQIVDVFLKNIKLG